MLSDIYRAYIALLRQTDRKDWLRGSVVTREVRYEEWLARPERITEPTRFEHYLWLSHSHHERNQWGLIYYRRKHWKIHNSATKTLRNI